jgi:hypothetical protein
LANLPARITRHLQEAMPVHTPAPLPRLPLALATALLLALAAWPAGAQTPDGGTLTIADIQRDIETFRALWALKLTPEQLTKVAERIAPVLDFRAKMTELAESPDARKIWLEMRATALAGKPVTDAMWERLDRVRARGLPPGMEETEGDAEARLWDLGRAAAREVMALLSPEQTDVLAQPEIDTVASSVLDEIDEVAGQTEEEWQQFKRDRITDLTADCGDLAAKLAQDLGKVFDDVRGLTVEQFDAQRPELQKRVRAIISARVNDEDRQQRGIEWLAVQMADNARFGTCLKEYAQQQAGQPAGQPGNG